MRTPDEIVARIDQVRATDQFGWAQECLITFLPHQQALPFLTEGTTAEQWAEAGGARTPDRDAVLAEINGYVEFAVGKVTDHRGLSANRSVQKMHAWMWLLGDDDVAAIDWERYQNYGAPVLRQIIDRLGLTVETGPQFDRMAQGLACREGGCDEGCG